jgi:hypothetical protein
MRVEHQCKARIGLENPADRGLAMSQDKEAGGSVAMELCGCAAGRSAGNGRDPQLYLA